MRTGVFRIGLGWLMGVGLAAAATAGPSTMNVIPTADTLPHREVVLMQSSARQQGFERPTHSYSGLVGVADRLELGFDADYAGGTTLNAKVRMLESKDGRFAVAGGFMNFRKQTGDGYVVATSDIGAFRLHGGLLDDGERRWMAGFESVVFGDVILMAEHASGRGGMTYAGFVAPLRGVCGASFGFYVGKPNSRHKPGEHGAFVSYGFRL
ncbi:MAG: hypothetical protein SNJ74_00905 [Fimbriimonadaceae bacterium]